MADQKQIKRDNGGDSEGSDEQFSDLSGAIPSSRTLREKLKAIREKGARELQKIKEQKRNDGGSCTCW